MWSKKKVKWGNQQPSKINKSINQQICFKPVHEFHYAKKKPDNVSKYRKRFLLFMKAHLQQDRISDFCPPSLSLLTSIVSFKVTVYEKKNLLSEKWSFPKFDKSLILFGLRYKINTGCFVVCFFSTNNRMRVHPARSFSCVWNTVQI